MCDTRDTCSYVNDRVRLNKEKCLPSLIARLIHVKSRLSSCSISSKLTSSPGTGPVEDPLGGNYSVILHSSFALETDILFEKELNEVKSVFSHLLRYFEIENRETRPT